MKGEGKPIPNLDDEVRGILAEFMVGVIKFEELVEVGRKLFTRFQQSLDILRRPSIYESSELIKSIIKANETKRGNAYVEAGCINACDITNNVSHLNTSLGGLQDCLNRAKGIVNELEVLLDKAGNALVINVDDQFEMEIKDSEQEVIASRKKLDAVGCASFMAVIYSMVKQDYKMQENIVSSLNLTSTSAELESYHLMWMLRPFINDDVMHQALEQVSVGGAEPLKMVVVELGEV
ncbi:uncharacterized protein [Spinacia oleracea]|uniref:Uncharacterized protein isoform X3 n=1 Tax=Spinacia oleracea TaxID=3562 RepID=A0ABM3QUG4_SPIOL|nr:uncharacterized protein LOC110786414 isoform X3 [Spinacia oleracea]